MENAAASYPSVSQLMAEYRHSWMRHMAARDVQIFDAQVPNGLRQGTEIFASATMLVTSCVLALIGNADKLIDVADNLSLQPVAEVIWEIKLFLTLLLVMNAFFIFVWVHRLFSYCAILMVAVPNAPKDPQCLQMSHEAGEVNITAARSYNRGLRAIYFSIASITWLISPIALMAATVITFGVFLRREFLSKSRALLLDKG